MSGRQLLRLVLAQIGLHSTMTGLRLAAPLLVLGQGYGAGPAGLLLAFFALAQVFLSLPAGHLADRYGMRLPVTLSAGVAMLGAGAAAVWPAFGMLCAAALLSGAAAATTQIALQRHVGRASPTVHERRTAFSWIAIAPAAANFAGPFAAGLLIDHAGHGPGDLEAYRMAFVFLAVLPFFSWWLIRGLPEAAPGAPAQAKSGGSALDLLRQRPMRRLLFVNWLQSAAWDAHTFLLPLLGHERELAASVIGSLMGVFAIAAAVVRMALPMLARHFAEWQVIYVSTLATAVALLAYPWMPGPLSMGACSILLGFAVGAVQPMILSLLHGIAPPDRQGAAMALRSMTMGVSSFLLPMLFGSVGAVAGAAGLFWLVAAMQGTGLRTVPSLARLEHSV